MPKLMPIKPEPPLRIPKSNYNTHIFPKTTNYSLILLAGLGLALSMKFLEEHSYSNDNVAIRQHSIADVIEKVSPSCVTIINHQSRGSGFVINKSGLILTCAHVIQNSPYVLVEFMDGTTVKAKSIGMDRYTDIAILKIMEENKVSNLSEVDFEELVRAGDFCLSIGANQGFKGTINFGIVSAIRRPDQLDPSIKSDFILQSDLGINVGNSGSPLFNMSGKVIGMAMAKTPLGDSISFFIPSKIIVKVVEQLTKKGRVHRPFIGLRGFDITPNSKDMMKQDNIKVPNVHSGVLVVEVFDGSAASQSGIQTNDVIVEVDGKRILSLYDLREAMGFELGKKLKVKVARLENDQTVILDKFIETKGN